MPLDKAAVPWKGHPSQAAPHTPICQLPEGRSASRGRCIPTELTETDSNTQTPVYRGRMRTITYPLRCSCLENPNGQRRLAGYSPWGRRVGHNWGDLAYIACMQGSFDLIILPKRATFLSGQPHRKSNQALRSASWEETQALLMHPALRDGIVCPHLEYSAAGWDNANLWNRGSSLPSQLLNEYYQDLGYFPGQLWPNHLPFCWQKVFTGMINPPVKLPSVQRWPRPTSLLHDTLTPGPAVCDRLHPSIFPSFWRHHGSSMSFP